MRAAVLWALVALTSPAMGGPKDVEAEYERLTEQMEGLSARTAWDGVERSFRQLEALKDAPLTLEDWFLGAQAARALGDAAACQRRLLAGFAQVEEGLSEGEEMDPRAFQWLGELNTQFGRVRIVARTDGELAAVEPPFQTDRQAAVAHARRVLARDGRFEGLLPTGDYTFGSETFTVQAGTDTKDRQKIKLK